MRTVLAQSSRRLATSGWEGITTSNQHQYQFAVGKLQISTTSQNNEKIAPVAPPSRSSLPARLRQAKPPSVPAEGQRWDEVVDTQSGQTYYWNKFTGEYPCPFSRQQVQKGSSSACVSLSCMRSMSIRPIHASLF